MKKTLLALALSSVAFTATAQEETLPNSTILNPAIEMSTIEALQQQIVDLEVQLAVSTEFVKSRSPGILELRDKIQNADADTQRIIDDLRALADQFKTGSAIQVVIRDSMEDVKGYIDEFRAGSAAQQAATASLQATLDNMQAVDQRRNDAVGQALAEIRRLKEMKDDLVALRIAGAFNEMETLYDEMVAQFETTVIATKALSDNLESLTVLPVQ
tara:strand:- start:824 stop:1468 length:645 start_codon:yes stop_codon:yes gene_type:complete